MTAVEVSRLEPGEAPSYAYDPAAAPRAVVGDGEPLTIVTLDARAGDNDGRPPGELFDLPARQAPANPLTGPIAVAGARPGDALVVHVVAIRPAATGWCAAAPGVGPLGPGRIRRARARTTALGDDSTPLIGCIGTAPDAAVASELAGPFGGNLDHPTLTAGARLVLPVFRPGGLLFVGDVHAAQGDGELAGWGLETAAEVDLVVSVEPGAAPAWPWLRTPDRLAVLTAGPTFEDARAAAVGAMLDALEAQLGLRPAEALALLSVAGDLRLGQAYGAEVTTVRIELPASLGLRPHPHPAVRPPAEEPPCPR